MPIAVKKLLIPSILALAGVSAANLLAQTPNEKPPTAAPAPTTADAKGPAAAEYYRLFDDWKAVLKDLRRLKVEYQSAALADQAKIKTQWDDQVAKGNDLITKLEASAEKAYGEA